MATATGFNVSAIERDLAEIWRAEATGEGEQSAVTRARVLTLLVYNDGTASAEKLDETLFAVTEAHPARVLVLNVDPKGDAAIEASVSAACRMSGARRKQLSCEQVNFTAGGSSADELPSAVAQLLAPDVPVFLWWRSVPDVENYVFNHLVKMSDRVVFDSTISHSPRQDVVTLARTTAASPDAASFTDFAWQRLTPWREMIAGFFDTPDSRGYLDRIDSLTIEYHPHDNHSDITTRAMLLGSWIADRLGWELDAAASSYDGDSNRFVFRKDGREVVVRFTPVIRDGYQDLLASATLGVSGRDGGTFRVSRDEIKRLASETRLGDTVQATRLLAYRSKTESELLATELGIPGYDRMYQGAVHIAGQIGAVREE